MKKYLIALFVLLAACTSTQKHVGKITLTQETNRNFQQYLAAIGINQPGAFAVSLDGRNSYYIWCREMMCMGGPTYKNDAKRACEKFGKECVVLAYRKDTLVPYDVVN